ncbi:MAG: HNH endonuclease [Anaerotignum sp.]
MPYKPKRPCRHGMCNQLAENGERYCLEHKREVDKHYNKYQRDPMTNKRYGSDWRKARENCVRKNPLCEACFKRGVLKAVEEVHHIKPLSQGGTHVESNLMSLCKYCHSKISADSGERWY